jgi:hypothetical protein
MPPAQRGTGSIVCFSPEGPLPGVVRVGFGELRLVLGFADAAGLAGDPGHELEIAGSGFVGGHAL